MHRLLGTLFVSLLILLLMCAVWAGLERGLFEAGRELIRDRWFLMTLLDVYAGFIIFFVWVAYKETHNGLRVLWLILIMTLGNIATLAYLLIQIRKLPPAAPVSALLLRVDARHALTA